jgi:hypothetical protein
VTGNLKIIEKQKVDTEESRKYSVAQTPVPTGKGKLKPQPQSKARNCDGNRQTVLAVGEIHCS